MRVLICCPKCGNKDLEMVDTTKSYLYRCTKCDNEFTYETSGYDIQENGEVDDGSHTFNELYHHRMILFSIICNTYKESAWKSWKHHDGTMYKDYFIVGITTPKGDYSYHYHKDNWDYFKVKELNNAPAYDGHKPEDIDRLFTLIK